MQIKVDEINFHPVLKDIENYFWLFLLSVRALSDLEIQQLLVLKNNANAAYGEFNNMLRKFNGTTHARFNISGNTLKSELNILNEQVFAGKAMAILTFDYLASSSYHAKIKKDKEFQFLRFVRNGAAHSNTFNLKDETGTWKIAANSKIEWNGRKIDRSLDGKTVFNNFTSVFEIWLLAKYFSDRLTLIDSES
jgi:hypothetical protein